MSFHFIQSKNLVPSRAEYNVYSTFQSHEPEFDYLKSLEIEEKINKIRWLRQTNRNHFLLSTNGMFLTQAILTQAKSSFFLELCPPGIAFLSHGINV